MALHGEQEAVRLRLDVRGRHEARNGRQFRLSDGVDYTRLRRPAQLQLDPNRWTPRLQGLRHRNAKRFGATFSFFFLPFFYYAQLFFLRVFLAWDYDIRLVLVWCIRAMTRLYNMRVVLKGT